MACMWSLRVTFCLLIVGTTQLLVRHEKAEFLLCTLQYGDDIPFPCLQQQLDLNLDEGSEISFYSEGKGQHRKAKVKLRTYRILY